MEMYVIKLSNGKFYRCTTAMSGRMSLWLADSLDGDEDIIFDDIEVAREEIIYIRDNFNEEAKIYKIVLEEVE